MERRLFKMKIAILGASGIGKYHIREFHRAGAEVVAILGSSKESSKKTSKSLCNLIGFEPRYYCNLKELIKRENLDAVSICTPAELHEKQTRECLESKLNVLCEKPFVLKNKKASYEIADELFKLSEEQGNILTVNTQWVSIIPYFQKYIDLKNITEFSMYGEPSKKGIEMIQDFIPHVNSILIKLMGSGKLENIIFPIKKEDEIRIKFNYINGVKKCSVECHFKYNPKSPRQLFFSINRNKFVRTIRENYQQSLVYLDKVIDIKDPLRISINRFIHSCNGEEPLISKEEIIDNLRIQDKVIENYNLPTL